MKKLAAVVVLIGTPAFAADMAVKAPPPAPVPTCVWCGWYIGLNAGGVWGSNDPELSANSSGWFSASGDSLISSTGSQKFNNSGFTGGGQLGYNWQAGSVVYGVESDFGYFHPTGSLSGAGHIPVTANFQLSESASANWLFTLRPRVGFSWNNWLLYGTGGLAVSHVKFSETFFSRSLGGDAAEAASLSSTRAGWAAGGGVEYALSKNWSIRTEYLYVQISGISGSGTFCAHVPALCTFGTPWSVQSGTFRENIVRGAINYRFN